MWASAPYFFEILLIIRLVNFPLDKILDLTVHPHFSATAVKRKRGIPVVQEKVGGMPNAHKYASGRATASRPYPVSMILVFCASVIIQNIA